MIGTLRKTQIVYIYLVLYYTVTKMVSEIYFSPINGFLLSCTFEYFPAAVYKESVMPPVFRLRWATMQKNKPLNFFKGMKALPIPQFFLQKDLYQNTVSPGNC